MGSYVLKAIIAAGTTAAVLAGILTSCYPDSRSGSGRTGTTTEIGEAPAGTSAAAGGETSSGAGTSNGASSGGNVSTSGGNGSTSGGTEDSPTGVRSSGSQQFETWLVSYRDCDGLLNAIRAAALKQVGPYGFEVAPYPGVQSFFEEGGTDLRWAREAAQEALPELAQPELERPSPSAQSSAEASMSPGVSAFEAPAPAAADSGSFQFEEREIAPQEGVDYSGTNVQVRGVDEADIIKTDGRRIIVSAGSWVTIVDVTGPEPIVVGRVNAPGATTSDMLFFEDRVLLMGNSTGKIRPLAESSSDNSETASSSQFQPYAPILSITEVLLDGTPRRGSTLQVEGSYLSSRSIESTAHAVFNFYPAELGFVQPQNPNSETSVAAATEANRRVIEESTLEYWLPQYRLIAADGSVAEEGSLLDCSRVNTPSEFTIANTLAVLSLDLSRPLSKGNSAATFAGGQTIYASADNLYVVTDASVGQLNLENEEDALRLEDDYRTSIHKFSLSDGGARYQASGSIKGHLLNQFSLNEHAGHLFVAATNGTPWGWNSSESFIHSLRQDGDRLINVGSVGNMGRGEEIYSVRFIGSRAYVVTFVQVDPLYVIDLTDPANMKVLGELKIPGYSAYLHPLGEGLLAGVGRGDEWGGISGAKVSLFDVSDPSDPRELDNYVLADAASDVEWDHRAFLWWEPEAMLVVPVRSYYNPESNGALVLNVDRRRGISLRGIVQHNPSGYDYYDDIYQIIRSLIIRDDLWTLSQAVLQSNNAATLKETARIRLPNF